MDIEYFQEELFFSTVRIEVEDPNTGEAGVGTGFFVQHPIPGFPERAAILLVTCRHCLLEGRGVVSLRFHRADPRKPGRPLLGYTVLTKQIPYNQVYCGHEDPDVDIAVLNVSDGLEKLGNIFLASTSIEQFADFTHPHLLPATEVWFVGYPTGLHDEVNNLPILRTGRIASHPRVDFNGKPEFLIDAHVYPGSSGSPVFAPIDDEMRFVGVLGQVYQHGLEGKLVKAGLKPLIDTPMGLGVVYKAPAVVDVIRKIEELAAAQLTHPAGGSNPSF